MDVRWLVAVTAVMGLSCVGEALELGDYREPEVGAVVVDPQAPRVLAFSCDATAVRASVPVDCLIQASHPLGDSVRCTLDRGDGRPALELGECLSPRSTTVRFGTPGSTSLTLTVTDAAGRQSSRAVVIEVTGTANQPPSLSAFVATPARGATPVSAELSWTASDPESGRLRCAIDVEADGEVEVSGLDCAIARHSLVLRGLGVHAVKLTATDELEVSSEATVSIEVLEPQSDLRVSHVDFGQSVVKEDLTLVEDKPALLRVSVLADDPGLATTVIVEASRGGTMLGRQTLTGPDAVPTSEDLSVLTRQFRLVLPREWVVPGISLRVRVDPDDALPETNEANNEVVLAPTISRGHVLHLTAVPVVHGGATGATPDLTQAVTDVWPVKGVETQTRAPYTFSGTLSGGGTGAWGALLSELAQVKALDGSQRQYYGFVHVWYGSGIAGIGYVGQGVATGRDNSLSTAAHELGHNFGRPHAPCGGAAGADPNFPYPGGRLGSWGWNGTQLLAPSQYVDLMSYCQPEWVSDYSYELVQQFMAGRQSFSPDVMLPDVRREDAALVSGRLLPSGEVRWGSLHRVHATPSLSGASEAVVVLTTRDGAAVRVPVALESTSEGDEQHFTALLPWPGEVDEVRLERMGQVLGRMTARASSQPWEAHATRVDQRTVRITWRGLPSLAVAHLDSVRTTLALAATGGELLVRVDGLDGGELELSGSDGLHSERMSLALP